MLSSKACTRTWSLLGRCRNKQGVAALDSNEKDEKKSEVSEKDSFERTAPMGTGHLGSGVEAGGGQTGTQFLLLNA